MDQMFLLLLMMMLNKPSHRNYERKCPGARFMIRLKLNGGAGSSDSPLEEASSCLQPQPPTRHFLGPQLPFFLMGAHTDQCQDNWFLRYTLCLQPLEHRSQSAVDAGSQPARERESCCCQGHHHSCYERLRLFPRSSVADSKAPSTSISIHTPSPWDVLLQVWPQHVDLWLQLSQSQTHGRALWQANCSHQI